MVWLVLLGCRSPEASRPPRCSPDECLDAYLFSDDAYDNTEAIGYMMRHPWSLVTARQKARLLALARPPAHPRTVERIAMLSTPTDVVFLDRLIRTGLHPDDDLPAVCASTPIHRVSGERNPYCVALLYQITACERSEVPACERYQELPTDWIDRRPALAPKP